MINIIAALNPLKVDYLRYTGNTPPNNTSSNIWILDSILNAFHHKKLLGECLAPKIGIKASLSQI